MYKKSVMHVQSCSFAYKTYCFLTFSSPSASLDLKVPTNRELTQRRERRQRERQNQQNNNFACASRFLYISLPSLHEISISRFRGCLHDTGATFASERVHSGSLSWLYICLHDTTTNSMLARVTWREFTPVLVPGREFHSGTKSRNGIV